MPPHHSRTRLAPGRRDLLRAGAVLALDLHLPRWLAEWRALGKRPTAAQVTPFITANENFYLVAVDPSFRPRFSASELVSQWALEIAGINGKVHKYGYDELLARATRKVPYTFECIGNRVGGTLIGNAQWHVIPLKKLLCGVDGIGNARSVMFRALDDFYSSVSAERTLDDHAFIALRMNDAPLPAAHGFPARVILPDLYGMKQPRWLRRITLQETAQTTSYWEERGWAGEVPVKTMSRLDPRGELVAQRHADLTGIAFAGQRGVSAVEVSLDGGDTWKAAELVTPQTPGVWSLWRYRWPAPTRGRHELMVRATDGRGRLQTARRQSSYPDGASGYDGETVRVS